MDRQIPLARYLWTRVRQQGVKSIMGVPGDMNLELLDYIKLVSDLTWVGNANELNAAYAADGYARVKNCPGVLVTTMGVGELSAINGIAGAYTEQVKVIHIVGTTATDTQSQRLMIHHNLGPRPDHRVFEKISSHVRCTYAWLDNAETAPEEIDRVIRECNVQSLPVYIYVPMDFVHTPVSSQRLEMPLEIFPPIDLANEERAVSAILHIISASKHPIVLIDVLTARHNAAADTRELVDALDFPFFATPMGKSIVDETHPRFCGIYNGAISYPGIADVVESSDCVINIGPLLSDSNTGGLSRMLSAEQLIVLESSHCEVRGERFEQVYLSSGKFPSVIIGYSSDGAAIRKITNRVGQVKIPSNSNPVIPIPTLPKDHESTSIVQSWIWKRLGQFTRPYDIVIVESGTAQFGIPDASFPPNTTLISQVYYGSIGYSVGCAIGAGLAQRELSVENTTAAGRLLLVVGDGSLQLTVQEIGTAIKANLSPIIIVINNNGYTIERAIHGPTESYNDITPWRHQFLLEFLGAKNANQCSREVRTKVEMERVLQLLDYISPSSIQLLEVYMAQMDIPWRLRDQISLVQRRNNK